MGISTMGMMVIIGTGLSNNSGQKMSAGGTKIASSKRSTLMIGGEEYKFIVRDMAKKSPDRKCKTSNEAIKWISYLTACDPDARPYIVSLPEDKCDGCFNSHLRGEEEPCIECGPPDFHCREP
jgi:uncharacterized short protein YbdD (DUF466 family)